jgi:hypothetical protein
MSNLFGSPAVRFVSGFLFACFFFVPVMWVVMGPPASFSFLLPMIAVGIVVGVMWVRRPPKFLRSAGPAS